MTVPVPILTDFISKGIDSIVQWKVSSDKNEITKTEFESMKEQWKHEMNKYVLDQVGRPDREFRDFVLNYEGSGDNVHPAVQFLSGAIRPFITIWVIIIITAFMFNGGLAAEVSKNMEGIPPQLWTIFEYVIGFWFGGRVIQHAVSEYSNGKVNEKKKQAEASVEVERERTRQVKLETGGEIDDEEDFSEKEKRHAFRRGPRGKGRR